MAVDKSYGEFTPVTFVGTDQLVGRRPSNPLASANVRTTVDGMASSFLLINKPFKFQSDWNASTNSPTLADGTGTQGHFYRVSVDGSTSLDGITDWDINDFAWFDGTVWRQNKSGELTPLYPTVGIGGDFATVGAAITAGTFSFQQISDVTDTVTTVIPINQNVFHVLNGFTWTKNGSQFIATGTTKYVTSGDGKFIGNTNTGEFNFAAACTFDARGFREITAITLIVNAGFHIVDNAIINMANAANFSFQNSAPGSSFTNFTLKGAGTSTGAFIFNGNSIIIDNLTLQGTFDTTAGTFNPIIDIDNTSASSVISNITSDTSAAFIRLDGLKSQIVNVDNMSMDSTNSSGNSFTNCNFDILDLSDAASSNNLLSNITVNTNATIGGDSNKGSSLTFTNDLTFSATADGNNFLLTSVGGSFADSGTNNNISNTADFAGGALFPTVGTSGDFANMKAVIDDGTVNTVEFISDVTDSTSFDILNKNLVIHIAKGFIWTIDDIEIGIDGTSKLSFGGAGALKIDITSGGGIKAFEIDNTASLDLSGLSVVDNSGSTGATSGVALFVSATTFFKCAGINFILPNHAQCGIANPPSGSTFNSLSITGGGSLTSGFITNSSDCIVDSILCEGSFNTSQSFPLFDFNPAGIGALVSNVQSLDVIPWMQFAGNRNQISNISTLNIDIRAASQSGLNNMWLGALDMNAGTSNDNSLSDVIVDLQAVTVGGDANLFVNMNVVLTLTVTGNDNIFASVIPGGYVDSGLRNKLNDNLRINNQTGTTYTFVGTDELVKGTNAAALTYTLPNNATENFPIGKTINIEQGGAGQITIAVEAGSTIASADSLVKSRTQNSVITIIKQTSTEYLLSGDMTKQ